MACDQYEKLISPYIDNELSKEESRKLEEHLKECEKCSEQLKAIVFMREMIAKSEDRTITPVSSMRKRIYFKIYRDLLIMFAGLVIIISIIAISGGLAQMLLFDKISGAVSIMFITGIVLLITGLTVLMYDIFIDMFKILRKK